MLTFRTYGTWLHGDDRGSVDDEHNLFGSPFLSEDPKRVRYESSRMRALPMIFNVQQRAVVRAAMVDQCQYRGWDFSAIAVLSNHAHVVIAHVGLPPERIARELKARATRWLRERGLVDASRPVWVDHAGSRRYLWTDRDVKEAMHYVLCLQDPPPPMRSADQNPSRQ